MMMSGTKFSMMQLKEQQVLHLEPFIITIISFCNPADCRSLFDNHWQEWYDDFKYDFEKKKQTVTIEQYRKLVHLDIQKRLCLTGSDLPSFNLDKMTKEEEDSVKHLHTKEKALM